MEIYSSKFNILGRKFADKNKIFRNAKIRGRLSSLVPFPTTKLWLSHIHISKAYSGGSTTHSSSACTSPWQDEHMKLTAKIWRKLWSFGAVTIGCHQRRRMQGQTAEGGSDMCTNCALIWLAGVTVKTPSSDLRSVGRKFDCQSGRYKVVTT